MPRQCIARGVLHINTALSRTVSRAAASPGAAPDLRVGVGDARDEAHAARILMYRLECLNYWRIGFGFQPRLPSTLRMSSERPETGEQRTPCVFSSFISHHLPTVQYSTSLRLICACRLCASICISSLLVSRTTRPASAPRPRVQYSNCAPCQLDSPLTVSRVLQRACCIISIVSPTIATLTPLLRCNGSLLYTVQYSVHNMPLSSVAFCSTVQYTHNCSCEPDIGEDRVPRRGGRHLQVLLLQGAQPRGAAARGDDC